MSNQRSPRRYLIVDTENYSGNFERALCAFMTGQVGECGVGLEQAKEFCQEHPEDLFEDLVTRDTDDRGIRRPAKIWPTPGWFNDGMGGHYREDEEGVEDRARKEHDKAATRYADTIRRSGDDKAADAFIAKNVGKPLMRFPAYQSVAISITREPTEEEIVLLKARARAWPGAKYYPKPEITGFRLVTVGGEKEEVRSV